MQRRKKKTNLHWYDEKRLEWRDKKHEKMTEKWLKENGLKVEAFLSSPLEQVQAASIAHHLLTDFSHLLNEAQAEALRKYSESFNNKKLRKKITQTQAYRILNIGKKVNRKLFRQYRQQA